MTNLDVIAQLDALTTEAGLLRQDLAGSEDMPALSTATCLVRLVKFNHDFAKLSAAARKTLAPLFGKQADGDGREGGEKKPRPRK